MHDTIMDEPLIAITPCELQAALAVALGWFGDDQGHYLARDIMKHPAMQQLMKENLVNRPATEKENEDD